LDRATLYPAARPLQAQDVSAFITRMKNIAGKELQSLEESILGTKIIVFGNIAVAVVVLMEAEAARKKRSRRSPRAQINSALIL
jgi:hypothetical protein